MFEKVRKPGRAKNIVAYIVFGAICLVFVFIGMGPSGLGGMSSGGSAASVNGESISIADFQNAVEQLTQRYQAQLDALPASKRREQSATLRRQALEQLINREVVAQAASGAGVSVSDDELAKVIGNIPGFQESGRFRASIYQNYLKQTRQTAGQFEKKLRKQVSTNELQEVFYQALHPMSVEAEASYRARESKINLRFLRFNDQSLRAGINVSSEKVADFLKTKQAEVEAYYEQNKSKFSSDEQVRASHILVLAKEGDADADAKALEKIKAIAERVKKEKFEALAAELSEDPGSKSKKGDLGYFGRGRMDPQFEQAAFGLPPGQVSAPVKTKFGYHLIKVTGKKEARTEPLESVKTDIAKTLIQDTEMGSVIAAYRQAATKLDEAKIKQLAKSHKLKWEETGEFAINQPFIPKIGENERILELAIKSGKAGAMLPELFSHAGSNFVVQVKSLNLAKEAEKSETDFERLSMVAFQRTNEVFSKWATSARESAKIERNAKILGR